MLDPSRRAPEQKMPAMATPTRARSRLVSSGCLTWLRWQQEPINWSFEFLSFFRCESNNVEVLTHWRRPITVKPVVLKTGSLLRKFQAIEWWELLLKQKWRPLEQHWQCLTTRKRRATACTQYQWKSDTRSQWHLRHGSYGRQTTVKSSKSLQRLPLFSS